MRRAGVIAHSVFSSADLSNILSKPRGARCWPASCEEITGLMRRARFDMEDKMLVPVSVIILASQLIIAVSDDVPKFNNLRVAAR